MEVFQGTKRFSRLVISFLNGRANIFTKVNKEGALAYWKFENSRKLDSKKRLETLRDNAREVKSQ